MPEGRDAAIGWDRGERGYRNVARASLNDRKQYSVWRKRGRPAITRRGRVPGHVDSSARSGADGADGAYRPSRRARLHPKPRRGVTAGEVHRAIGPHTRRHRSAAAGIQRGGEQRERTGSGIEMEEPLHSETVAGERPQAQVDPRRGHAQRGGEYRIAGGRDRPLGSDAAGRRREAEQTQPCRRVEDTIDAARPTRQAVAKGRSAVERELGDVTTVWSRRDAHNPAPARRARRHDRRAVQRTSQRSTEGRRPTNRNDGGPPNGAPARARRVRSRSPDQR